MPRARRLTILVLILVFVLGIFWLVVGYGWFLQKQERVANGVANPKFPYRDYTLEELNTMYPQYLNVDVPTTQIPEETYTKLKQFLAEENLDQAVGLFSERNRDTYSKLFESNLRNNRFGELRSKLENTIIKKENDCTVVRCVYIMAESKSEINFTKNSDGKWLIESL